jgi:hypothetical protein
MNRSHFVSDSKCHKTELLKPEYVALIFTIRSRNALTQSNLSFINHFVDWRFQIVTSNKT